MLLGHLTTAFILAVIYVNMLGLALAGARLILNYPLARAVTPLCAALLFFFCEHFIGFGRLSWLAAVATFFSCWMVLRGVAKLREHWQLEAVFLAAFVWAFAWRFSFPGIVASSEKMTGLAMISSYLPGGRLPPVDVWLPPFPFDVYYSFQHYAAALLGRAFGLSPGLTYNVAFCLIAALAIMCATSFVHSVCRKAWCTALVVAAFAFGGTGASLPVHLLMTKPGLHSSMRFIGGTVTAEHADTPVGRWLVEAAHVPKIQPLELPSETFAYLLSVGDYHPPMSGFLLLTIGLLCLTLIESGAETRYSQAVLAGSAPVCMVANGWTLPLQTAVIVTWIAYRLRQRQPPDWKMLAAGAALASAFCYPFLSTFAYHSADYHADLTPIPMNEHTPPLLGAILLYPLVVGLLLPLAFGERKGLATWACCMWLALLVLSELFYVNDAYSGPFNRFNSTLKWWPWIQAGGLLTAGAFGMRSGSRTCRYAMTVVLAIVSAYGVDMLKALTTSYKADSGRLDGTAWISDDPIENAILEFLKAQPPTTVLQRLEAGAFTPAPGLIMFAGQKAFLGWPEHEKLWRGQRADIGLRAAQVRQFYSAELPNSTDWLLQNGIEHVLWLKPEYKLPTGTFDRLNNAITSAYFWREYYRVGEFRVGLWSRRPYARAAPRPGA